MTTWILIYWIMAGSPGSYGGLHVATGSVEFSDEKACHNAFASMQRVKTYDQPLFGVCVPEAAP